MRVLLCLLLTFLLALVNTSAFGKGKIVHVDDDAPPGGNGSGKWPYDNLHAAIDDASATTDMVVVKVHPGNYALIAPLVIAGPIELRGSSELAVDSDGLPTGEVAAGSETRIISGGSPAPPALIQAERSDGEVIPGITIRGFIFQATDNAFGVNLIRAQQFEVSGNVFLGPAFVGLQALASSGRVKGNYFHGTGSGAVLAGGTVASPARVEFAGNRSVGNRSNGLLLVGVPFGIPDRGNLLEAIVRGNDVSANTATPGFSTGIRIFVMRRDLGVEGDDQSGATVRADIRDNRVVGNRFGIVVDAGFPYRLFGTTCDPRTYSGAIDVTLAGNTLADSIEHPALITFTRNSATVNPATLNRWQYLHGATFRILDRDGLLSGALVDHPEADPFIGPCRGDSYGEPLGNTLLYNGIEIDNESGF